MVNFFIYGGCVSRDAYELVKDEHYLTGYIARQSLISANSLPETRINTANSSTNFNSRMVVGDIKSSLFSTLREKSNEVEVFLFDILSERLGVYRLQGGRYITNSAELSKSSLLDDFPYAKAKIHFGTSQHFELWKQGVLTLKDILVECGLFSNSIYIETIWTDHSCQGSNVPKFRNWSAHYANKLYEPYFSYLRELGFRSIKPSLDISLSDENHKWGSSPYHYQPEYYQEILVQVFDQISEK
ncbi:MULTISPECIES: DUF6270 domain-containing protein [Micrococcaceae]|uniref:DUF6270 domain-containing protein n=1 Tax=Micrococcaceae TaxID=1268 RepID=UPI00105F7C11|nr:DUF6270 domain-containing protein [Arthrobacter sp. JUb115]TDU29676.1 hypothetical protein EDF61_102422 [Arthrobacter sp. JUb115]